MDAGKVKYNAEMRFGVEGWSEEVSNGFQYVFVIVPI
jgi:hypothetical protein